MGKIQKQLEKMLNNPRGWRIGDLKTLADRIGLSYRQPGTSHVTFRAKNGQRLTVPLRRPIKPIYIKLFIELIFELEKNNECL
ncbi:MAG: hypothetical protein A3E82_07205 [Gammaproteobacteria bacterium RIFCSPHIGHO2_12_FULL_38_11]|nr:MAG: hypothetical protein A3E82_07205 [Gammaproteobacteria bacterium RIFCSPHIGHO2_12_FULL_38_11]